MILKSKLLAAALVVPIVLLSIMGAQMGMISDITETQLNKNALIVTALMARTYPARRSRIEGGFKHGSF